MDILKTLAYYNKQLAQVNQCTYSHEYSTATCWPVGRRIAELEMHIALAQLIRNFNIEYRDEQPLNFIQKLFVYPERQMDLAFVDRK